MATDALEIRKVKTAKVKALPTYQARLFTPYGIFRVNLERPIGIPRTEKPTGINRLLGAKDSRLWYVWTDKENLEENKETATYKVKDISKIASFEVEERETKHVVTPMTLSRVHNVWHRFEVLGTIKSAMNERLKMGLLVLLCLGCLFMVFMMYQAVTKKPDVGTPGDLQPVQQQQGTINVQR